MMRITQTAFSLMFAALAAAFTPALSQENPDAARTAKGTDLGDFKRPVGPYDMAKELLSDEAAHRADANLGFSLFEQYGDRKDVLFLVAEVRNTFDEPICIPSMLYDSGPAVTTKIILTLRDGDNEIIDAVYNLSILRWPASHFVILMPGATDGTSVDLTQFYNLEDEEEIKAALSFPAFFCRAMMSAYPVTQSMIDNPVGLSDLGPIAPIRSEDVIIFRGEAVFP